MTELKQMRLLLITLLFGANLAYSQDFIVENATVFDGEELHRNYSVLVRDGSIAAVGRSIETDVPKIDGSGKFLMPAMTNSHVHAWAVESLRAAARAGVLNLLDMHGMEAFQPMLATLRDSTNSARYFYAGNAATVPEGHGTQYGFPVATLSRPEEAAGFVDARLKAGAHYLKIIVEPSRPTLDRETVQALVEAAHARETSAVVHISRASDALDALRSGADGLVHIWWDGKARTSELRDLRSERDFFIIPTLLTSHLALEMIRKRDSSAVYLSNQEISAEVKKAYDAGISILAGTDPPNVEINYGTDLYKELVLLREAGIPALDVLKSATSLPARYFRLGKIGEIKPGYSADLLLLEGDPIRDMREIASIQMIWKNGKSVDRSKP